MKPSEEIAAQVALYRATNPDDFETNGLWIGCILRYLDEQYAITNSTTTMKKTKVNKLKTAKTAVAKKAVKKASKKK